MNLQSISESQASPEVPINENFEVMDWATVYAKDPTTSTGLTWGFFGGRWGGFLIAAGTLTLVGEGSPTPTNYIVVNRSTGAISVSTEITNWNDTTNYARVYKVFTNASAVLSDPEPEDHRAGPNGVIASVPGDVTAAANIADNRLVRGDGGAKGIQESPITVADTTGDLSRTGGIDIEGTNTDDSAAAGYIGEYISSAVLVGSAVALTTATPADITSISLTAGDWDVTAMAFFNPDNTTNTTLIIASISTTSATPDTTPGGYFVERYGSAGLVHQANYGGSTVGPKRISLASTTTIYLVARADFTVSTNAAYGLLSARRVR